MEWKREYDYPNNPYVLGCYKRAITVFESLHFPMEDIFVMIDVNDFDRDKNIRYLLKNFSRYVEKSLLFRLKHQTIPYIFPEDKKEGTYKTHRFSLCCKTSDFKYVPLLKAIFTQDLGLKPSIFHRVYFININKKTILHVYDDRGCDLLATSSETISHIYEGYDNWILDYDRNEIDKVFK